MADDVIISLDDLDRYTAAAAIVRAALNLDHPGLVAQLLLDAWESGQGCALIPLTDVARAVELVEALAPKGTPPARVRSLAHHLAGQSDLMWSTFVEAELAAGRVLLARRDGQLVAITEHGAVSLEVDVDE